MADEHPEPATGSSSPLSNLASSSGAQGVGRAFFFIILFLFIGINSLLAYQEAGGNFSNIQWVKIIYPTYLQNVVKDLSSSLATQPQQGTPAGTTPIAPAEKAPIVIPGAGSTGSTTPPPATGTGIGDGATTEPSSEGGFTKSIWFPIVLFLIGSSMIYGGVKWEKNRRKKLREKEQAVIPKQDTDEAKHVDEKHDRKPTREELEIILGIEFLQVNENKITIRRFVAALYPLVKDLKSHEGLGQRISQLLNAELEKLKQTQNNGRLAFLALVQQSMGIFNEFLSKVIAQLKYNVTLDELIFMLVQVSAKENSNLLPPAKIHEKTQLEILDDKEKEIVEEIEKITNELAAKKAKNENMAKAFLDLAIKSQRNANALVKGKDVLLKAALEIHDAIATSFMRLKAVDDKDALYTELRHTFITLHGKNPKERIKSNLQVWKLNEDYITILEEIFDEDLIADKRSFRQKFAQKIMDSWRKDKGKIAHSVQLQENVHMVELCITDINDLGSLISTVITMMDETSTAQQRLNESLKNLFSEENEKLADLQMLIKWTDDRINVNKLRSRIANAIKSNVRQREALAERIRQVILRMREFEDVKAELKEFVEKHVTTQKEIIQQILLGHNSESNSNEYLNFTTWLVNYAKAKNEFLNRWFNDTLGNQYSLEILNLARSIISVLRELHVAKMEFVADAAPQPIQSNVTISSQPIKEAGTMIGQFRAISEEYRQKRGWKIHLSVKAENHKVVYEWLRNENNCPYGVKYGLSDNQIGKDFTIYVGSFESMIDYAKKLEINLGTMLENQTPGSITDDIQINSKVMARFDAGPKLMQFHQYGYHGVPFLIEDVSDWLFSDNKTDVERRNYYIRQSLAKAYRILAEAYGEYFTGRDDALASLIFARFKLKVVEKKIALNIKILVVYDGVENKTIKIRKSADAKIFYIRQRPSRLSHEWEIYVNPDILAQKPTAETDELLSKLFELKTAKNPISYRIERLGYCTWDSQNDIGKVSRIGIIAHVPSKPKTVGTKPGKVLVTKKELHISVVISDKISLSPGEAETAGIAKGEDLTGVDQKLAIEVAKEKKDAIDRGVEAVDTILPALEKLEEYVVRMQTAVHRILDESDKDIKKIAGVAKEPETAGKIATNEGYIAYMAMLINMIPNIYTYRGYLKAVDQLQQFEQSLAAYSRLLPAAAVSVEAQMAVGEVLHEALQGHPAGSLARDLEAQLAETSRKIQEEIERTETLARKEADNRKAKLEAEKELEKIRRERLKRLILRRRLQLNRYVTGFFHNINMRTRYIVLRIRNMRIVTQAGRELMLKDKGSLTKAMRSIRRRGTMVSLAILLLPSTIGEGPMLKKFDDASHKIKNEKLVFDEGTHADHKNFLEEEKTITEIDEHLRGGLSLEGVDISSSVMRLNSAPPPETFTLVPLENSNLSIRTEKYKGSSKDIIFVHLHRSEPIALDVARKIGNMLQINVVTLMDPSMPHNSDRYGTLMHRKIAYAYDPNKVFTLEGCMQTLNMRNSNYKFLDKSVREEIAQDLLEKGKMIAAQFMEKGTIIAVHNTENQTIADFKGLGMEVNIGERKGFGDSFFVVTERADYDVLKSAGYNVVLQKLSDKDDGSLSYLCSIYGQRYINIDSSSDPRINASLAEVALNVLAGRRPDASPGK